MEMSEIEPNFWRWTVAHFRKAVDMLTVAQKYSTEEVPIGGLTVLIPMNREEYGKFMKEVNDADEAMGNAEKWTVFFYYLNRGGVIQVKYGSHKGVDWSQNQGKIYWSDDALTIPDDYLTNITLPQKESFPTSPTLGRRYVREYLSQKLSNLIQGMDKTPYQP